MFVQSFICLFILIFICFFTHIWITLIPALLKAAREEKKEGKTDEKNITVDSSTASATATAMKIDTVDNTLQTAKSSTPLPPPPSSSSLPPSLPLPSSVSLLLPAPPCAVPTVTYSGNLNLLPELSAITAAFLAKKEKTALAVKFFVSTSRTDHLPCFSLPSRAENINGDCAIARYLVRESTESSLLGTCGSLGESLVDQWLDYYTSCLSGNRELSDIASLINTVLASKTYLVNDKLSLADISIFVLLQKNKFVAVSPNSPTNCPHTNRWYSLISYDLSCVGTLPVLTAEKKYPPKGAGKAGGKTGNNEKKTDTVKDVTAMDGKYRYSYYNYYNYCNIITIIIVITINMLLSLLQSLLSVMLL